MRTLTNVLYTVCMMLEMTVVSRECDWLTKLVYTNIYLSWNHHSAAIKPLYDKGWSCTRQFVTTVDIIRKTFRC